MSLDWLPIDFELLKNPVNWLIVILMVLIAALAVRFIFPDQRKED